MPTYFKTSAVYSAQEVRDNLPNGVKNLLGFYAMATPAEKRKGQFWFSDAYYESMKLSILYNVPIDVVIDVVAILSPKLNWEMNIPAAENVIRLYQSGTWVPDYHDYLAGNVYLTRTKSGTKKCPNKPVLAEDPRIPSTIGIGGLKQNFVKALWRLQGHNVISGPKVIPFRNNILTHDKPFDPKDGLPMDSHNIQLWFGKLEKGTYKVPDNFMPILIADFITAATVVGLDPRVFLAIIWELFLRLSKKVGR